MNKQGKIYIDVKPRADENSVCIIDDENIKEIKLSSPKKELFIKIAAIITTTVVVIIMIALCILAIFPVFAYVLLVGGNKGSSKSRL